MPWQLVKTALLGRWEVALVGKNNTISKHGTEVTDEQMQEIAFDFLRKKLDEMPAGFKIKPVGKHMKVQVEPLAMAVLD